MEEIEFPWWLFEGRPRQGKNVLPDGRNWLCYFAGSSKSHRENSISFIFLESPHQVDEKNVVKCRKDFLSYFTTLETYRDLHFTELIFTVILPENRKSVIKLGFLTFHDYYLCRGMFAEKISTGV